MAQRRAALLLQQARGAGMQFRLRAGPDRQRASVGRVADRDRRRCGDRRGRGVRPRAWPGHRDPVGLVGVLLDGETEARRYAADALQRALE
jgi:hypothetical protein